MYLSSPKTISEAMTQVVTTAGAFELADQVRKEEPMEVGAMAFVTTKPLLPQVSEVAESMAALRHELTAIKQRLDALPAAGAGRGRGRGWTSGRRGQTNGRTLSGTVRRQTTAAWPAIDVDNRATSSATVSSKVNNLLLRWKLQLLPCRRSYPIRKTPEGTRQQALSSASGVQSALSHLDWLWCL